MAKIYPSLIGADLLHLGNVIKQLNSVCDGYHIDIMDNHFVPNLTWGKKLTNEIERAAAKPSWVHLMVDNPQEWLHLLDLPNGSTLSFHYENTKEKVQMIRRIQEKKWRASIAVNPETPIEKILPLLNVVDEVLLMSVQPGFYGQNFKHEAVEKIDPLIKARSIGKLNFTIAMDGGINETNIQELAQKGVDTFAVASAIFKHDDIVAATQKLYELTK